MSTKLNLDSPFITSAWREFSLLQPHPSHLRHFVRSEKGSNRIHVFDGTQASGTSLHTFETLHQSTVSTIKYNPVYETAVSVDKAGIVEYWTGPKHEYKFPKNVDFRSKLDTDLFDFVKNKTYPTSLAFSPDGKKMASISLDRKTQCPHSSNTPIAMSRLSGCKGVFDEPVNSYCIFRYRTTQNNATIEQVRVFHFVSGRLQKVVDEGLARFQDLQHQHQQLPNMEFGRRMATERDLEKSDAVHYANIIFDASGHFVLYATMLGVKIVNLVTNRCASMLGKPENLRPLHLALFQPHGQKHPVYSTFDSPAEAFSQGRTNQSKVATTLEMEGSENPTLLSIKTDPTLFCTAYKKNRFYMFSRRSPDDIKSPDADRDIFNEKPSKEDIISATEGQGVQRIYEQAILHTSLGDVHIRLFGKDTPRSAENFCVHARNGYYNGHIFHRVIKGSWCRLGTPQVGIGTGNDSNTGCHI
ncbi:hypothetical protein MSG28_008425 [Choristoneura fumiferana]|uniref:Uncharacterized protein n=1 Tax=Choristoneura fumiferana TaxID=7141 RepID=A0ACC0J4J7_CHOFU|nr:hypothetical protein MSG28_008425 [Choristoneura fumiferana]